MLLPKSFHSQSFEHGSIVTYAGIPPELFGCALTDTLILSGLRKTFSDCNKFILFLAPTLISFCISVSVHVRVVILEICQCWAQSSNPGVLGEDWGQNEEVTVVLG